MLQDIFTSSHVAYLNPTTLTWIEVLHSGGLDPPDEAGWTLLPNGNVLSVYSWAANEAAVLDPQTRQWTQTISTIVDLHEPNLDEQGPVILRPDGTGALSYFTGALLPNGNILIACGNGTGLTYDFTNGFGALPTLWYEFNGSGFTHQPSPTSDAFTLPQFVYNMIVLPTGQILQTNGDSSISIYTPDGISNYDASWRPVITNYPHSVAPGSVYKISGVLFNGMSQAGMYGDDFQGATNYPLLRITHVATGRVFHSRTFNHSSMGVGSHLPV